jgi:methylmalonyl-CoA/ethylmalonyl-CoA epimerase
MPKITRIDHIAIVVDEMDGPLSFWQDALGLELTHIRDVPAELAEVAFLPAGGSEIELVHPTTSESGLVRYLEKRGPGLHHLCLEVDDLDGMLVQLKEKGIALITESPKTSPDGKRYAFIHPKSASGVLVELYELSGKQD